VRKKGGFSEASNGAATARPAPARQELRRNRRREMGGRWIGMTLYLAEKPSTKGGGGEYVNPRRVVSLSKQASWVMQAR
jgi:hypothetical protein